MRHLTRRSLLQAGAVSMLAAPAFGRDVSQADLRGDVVILRRAWETMHPGLYRYSSPGQISARLDALDIAWAAPGSFRDRFLALSRVTASVRCGHTYPNPYNGGEAVIAGLYPDRALVPFRFRWLAGRMVVTHDDSAERALPRGTIITAIDGVETTELLNRLIPLARADGSNDAKRISLMEVRGDDRYETFDIHLPLILPELAERASFTLADGSVIQAGLQTLAERKAASSAAGPRDDHANPWSLTMDADGIARLTMPGWALYDSDFGWEAWLGQTMDDLTAQAARGLIVDLRGNEGGLDCGDLIVSRLIDRDLMLPTTRRFVRYRRAPDDLRPYLDTWERSFLDWGDAAAGPGDDGLYRLSRPDDSGERQIIRPQGRRFSGPVVTLCDASNSSATFQFARTVKDNGLATLMGQTTGGNRRGINGAAFFFLRLPASGLEVDLPLIASFPDAPQPDAGIEPDIAVPTTVLDIASGRDTQMAAAVARILSV